MTAHARIARARWPTAACAALGALALAACAVGPDFKRPEAPAAQGYTDATLPQVTVASDAAHGDAQQFAAGGRLQRQWWTLFHSEPLDRLIEQALRDSPTVASAQAALRQAREGLAAERGATWPSVSGQASVQREQFAGASIGQPGTFLFTLYNASVNVSYTLDVFGGIRRQLEALQAQVDNADYQLQATYLALTSNLATTAIREASLRAQIRATEAWKASSTLWAKRRLAASSRPNACTVSRPSMVSPAATRSVSSTFSRMRLAEAT